MQNFSPQPSLPAPFYHVFIYWQEHNHVSTQNTSRKEASKPLHSQDSVPGHTCIHTFSAGTHTAKVSILPQAKQKSSLSSKGSHLGDTHSPSPR